MISSQRFHEIIQKFETINPVLIVGDIGVDKYTYGHVSRISPEAPVPVLEVTNEWMKLGLAANVADNLASLNVKATICGLVGDDNNASVLENLLEDNNVNVWGVIRDPERSTTFKERIVTETQQICRVDYETKNEISTPSFDRLKERVAEFLPGHSSVIIEDYGKGLFTKKSCEFVIKSAQEHGKMISVDPSRTTPPLFYKGANLLKPNRLESLLMVESFGYGRSNSVEDTANILIDKLEVEKVIITLGSEGMAMLDTKGDGRLKLIPTVANEVFDVSGAGDTSISAIVASLSADASLEEAAWIGNCAAGVVVAKKGTALVTQKELTAFYERLKSSTEK